MAHEGSLPLAMAICGGGACGLSVLTSTLEEIRDAPRINRIYVFEKRGQIGPGLVYSEASQAAIINMAAETMGIHQDDPLHFAQWLASSRPQFSHARYPPRYVFGEYLTSLLDYAQRQAVALGVHLEFIHEEVVSLCRDGNQFILVDGCGKSLVVDRVVLALGNFLAQTQPHLEKCPGYLDSPWPLSRLNTIPQEAPVCIVGTRLSGIDAAIHLVECGHRGAIFLVSRSGRLPSVQGLLSKPYRHRHVLEVLARDFEHCPKTLRLHELIDILKPLAERTGEPDWEQLIDNEEPLKQLSCGIAEAKQGTHKWRSLLDAAAPMLESIWNSLLDSDQAAFLDDWNSLWYSVVHAMPYGNAQKLHKLLEENKVKIDQLVRVQGTDRGFLVSCARGEYHSDYLVEATGLERKVTRMKSPFVQSLLTSSIFEEHHVGGLSVHQYTLESRITKGVYAIGSLTTGVHFYTNGIDRNAAHASRIAKSLVGKAVYPPGHVALILQQDSGVWRSFVKGIIPSMVNRNLNPFIFVCTSTDQSLTGQEVEPIRPRENDGQSDPPELSQASPISSLNSETTTTLDPEWNELAGAFGIYVQPFSLHSSTSNDILRVKRIDIGLLLGKGSDVKSLAADIPLTYVCKDPLVVAFKLHILREGVSVAEEGLKKQQSWERTDHYHQEVLDLIDPWLSLTELGHSGYKGKG